MTKEELIEYIEKARKENRKISIKEIIFKCEKNNLRMVSILSELHKKELINVLVE
ncbi:hypothetical protein SAMN02745174_02206 [Cetobacterium ceti]|uniref:Uncharacterized protein n=1 Tax=Cetobacterium ceti TaxID=180163 RepID=A0A1T4Q6Y8_9FUSO|nr:hypothetical protein [Cetobacterium ceti]SJZ99532.1 hypothetical protein SAMN02745174_02206 [Cetobacterium ceti]